MLMTVLKGDLATRQSKALIRLFKRMKDAVEEGRSLVGRRELLELSARVSESFAETLDLRASFTGSRPTSPPSSTRWARLSTTARSAA